MEVLSQTNLSSEESAHRFRIIQYKVREQQIERIWQDFENTGFQPILIKGWAAAQYYPDPFERGFVDIDLIVSPQRYEEAAEFSKSLKSALPIDLHKGPRHLDSLDFEEILSAAVYVKCGNTRVRVPCLEDHLRMLCIHWLTDGGADREKLWDIYYSLADFAYDLDWNRLLNTVSDRRRRWIECTIGLAHKYLALNIEGTPVAAGAKRLPPWFIKAVEKEWASGVRMQPLTLYLNDRKKLWKQIKKRLPPNPIQATILQEGDLDKYPRFWYQLANIFSRFFPSLKRIKETIKASAN